MNEIDKAIMMLDENGLESLDPTPMQIPAGIRRPRSIQEKVKDMVRYELSRVAGQEGHETWEEADDFVVGDEPELMSPYQLSDEQEQQVGDFIEERPVEKPAEKKTAPEGEKNPPSKPPLNSPPAAPEDDQQ